MKKEYNRADVKGDKRIYIDVNYKNQKRYKTAKHPIRQPIYLTWLIEVLSRIMLSNKEYKVHVVVATHRGNYLHAPFWNFRNKRKVPHHTTLTKILSAEDVENMSAEEIYKIKLEEIRSRKIRTE